MWEEILDENVGEYVYDIGSRGGFPKHDTIGTNSKWLF